MLRRPITVVALTIFALAVSLASQVAAEPAAAAMQGSGTVHNHGQPAPVYAGPGDMNALVGTAGAGTRVTFHCYVRGQTVSSGEYDPSNIWNALDSGGYISDALVLTGTAQPVVGRCPWNEFGANRFPVAYTRGAGFDPRMSPQLGAGVAGGHLPEGQLVTVSCETTGDNVTDSIPWTSNFWDRLGAGGYIPNAFLDTQTSGATPGMPSCGPDPTPTHTTPPVTNPPPPTANPVTTTPTSSPPTTSLPSFPARLCDKDPDGRIVATLAVAPDPNAPTFRQGYKITIKPGPKGMVSWYANASKIRDATSDMWNIVGPCLASLPVTMTTEEKNTVYHQLYCHFYGQRFTWIPTAGSFGGTYDLETWRTATPLRPNAADDDSLYYHTNCNWD